VPTDGSPRGLSAYTNTPITPANTTAKIASSAGAVVRWSGVGGGEAAELLITAANSFAGLINLTDTRTREPPE